MQYAYTFLTLASAVSAHYTFSDLTHNGAAAGGPWEYIREHTTGYFPTKFPGNEVDMDGAGMSPNIEAPTFACQPGAESGAGTSVLDIMPGDTLGFVQAFGGTGIEHPGPAQVYMSKAPGSVTEYDGSGEWFKIHQKLLCSPPGGGAALTDAWCMWGRNTIEFSIPDGIEPGEYLIRAEHIGLHGAHDNNAEFYFSCAQVNLGGSGTGGASSSGSTEGTTSTNSTGSSTGYAPPTTSAAPSTDYSAPASDYNVETSDSSSDSCGDWTGGWKMSKRQSNFETVSFPGAYSTSDPTVNFNLWDDSLAEYPEAPGPAVIPGGETEGSSNGATSSKHKRALRQLAHPRNFRI